jgi:undecaprenyl-diphosphatase
MALTPVIWWNMHHGWITLQHTAHHFEQSDRTLLESIRTFAEFSGSQLGVVSPVTCVLVFVINTACLFQAGRFVFRKDEACRSSDSSGTYHVSRAAGFLLLTGIAVLLPIALLSLKQRVNANWPAPFYIAPVILVAGWYRGFFNLGPRIDSMRKTVLPGVLTGAVLSVLFYALPFVMPVIGLEGSAVDVTARVRGWKELALRVDSIRKILPRPERTFLVTRRRQTAAELAFYISGNPRPYRWSGNRMRVTTQYELWPGPGSSEEGMDALVVIDVDKIVPPDLPQHFDDFRMLRQVEIPLGNGKARRYMIYFGKNFRPTVL